MTTLNEKLWERMLGGPGQVAAAGPLSAQPLAAREEFFDLISFMIRQIDPLTGDLGYRLASEGKTNPFVTEEPVSEEVLIQVAQGTPKKTEDDAVAMRAELDRFVSVTDQDLLSAFLKS